MSTSTACNIEKHFDTGTVEPATRDRAVADLVLARVKGCESCIANGFEFLRVDAVSIVKYLFNGDLKEKTRRPGE